MALPLDPDVIDDHIAALIAALGWTRLGIGSVETPSGVFVFFFDRDLPSDVPSLAHAITLRCATEHEMTECVERVCAALAPYAVRTIYSGPDGASSHPLPQAPHA